MADLRGARSIHVTRVWPDSLGVIRDWDGTEEGVGSAVRSDLVAGEDWRVTRRTFRYPTRTEVPPPTNV